MTRLHSLSIVVLFTIVLLLALTIWLQPARADQTTIATPTATATIINQQEKTNIPVPPAEQEELKGVIQAYFETRYRALSTLQPNDMSNLVSKSSAAQDFLDSEQSKLAIEIKNAELNHLRYADYKYFLDFKTITVDPFLQTANVSVVEGHDVIFEISKELNPDNPIVSKTRNLEHLIVLYKEGSQWKIVSDEYEDDLWRLLRQTGTSTVEMFSGMDVPREESQPLVQQSAVAQTDPLCPSLPTDDSTHPYNRADAVAYAHQYADEDPIKLRNLDYPDYSPDDCTNFVSQAIYEGGNASMAIPAPLPPPNEDGQLGWYILNDRQRASAWNDVDSLYDFITDTGAGWDEGPEGCVLSEEQQNLAEPGDLIKFDWTGNDSWDHMAMIVSTQDDGQGNRMYWVAAHTADHDDYPYTTYYTIHPDMEFKLIHIERSDGYPPVKAEIVAEESDPSETSSSDAGRNFGGSCYFSYTANEIYFGKCQNQGDVTSGFQFKDVPIPRGAQLKYAYLQFTVDGPYSAPLQLMIHGENTGNPLNLADAPPLESRQLSPVSVSWNIDNTDIWDIPDTYLEIGKGRRITPDLSLLLDSIVNSDVPWEYGNTLSFIIKNDPNWAPTQWNPWPVRRIIAYERTLQDPMLSPAKLMAAYDFDNDAPTVLSIIRASANPTSAASVDFTVTFSEAVTGVEASDFSLAVTGGISGASVSAVTAAGSQAVYTVTVDAGVGGGALRLDIPASATIADLTGTPLAGLPYQSGEEYTILVTLPGKAVLTFPSGDIGDNYYPAYIWLEVTEGGTESKSTQYYLWVNGPAGNIIKQWYPAAEVCSSGVCSVTPSTALGGGAHTWWVQTSNSAGNGPWSDPMTFDTTPPTVPGKATLVSPSGDIGDNYTPLYIWSEVTENEAESMSTWYYLWVNGPTGNVIKQWYQAVDVCNDGACFVRPTEILGSGSHTWWVQTWNAAGYGPWSDEMNFNTAVPTVPGKAVLLSPSGSAASNTPTYTWNEVTESETESMSTWYYLWVNGPSGTPVIKKWYKAVDICGAGICAVTPDTALASGSHKWWVQTWNPAGYGPWSDPLTFDAP